MDQVRLHAVTKIGLDRLPVDYRRGGRCAIVRLSHLLLLVDAVRRNATRTPGTAKARSKMPTCQNVSSGQNATRDFANALSNLSVPLQQLGRLDEAVASCRKALAIKPDFPDGHYNLGNAIHALGQRGAALASYERAIALNPDHVDALGNMGCLLQELGRLEDATVKSPDCIIAS